MANTWGRSLRVTTFGESHGPAIGAVVDGCPAGMPFSVDHVIAELRRDRPVDAVATTRREPNDVRVLSGVLDGRTLGTPIALLIENLDVDSSPYEGFRGRPRPGHGDMTWHLRYGHVDHRGGGRASGRETTARVAASSVARRILVHLGIDVSWELVELAGLPCRAEDERTTALSRVVELASEASTTGGVIRVRASGVPAGLGEPVFGKLSAELGGALFSIGGVKAVEFGDGSSLAAMTGPEANDAIEWREGRPVTATNRCGGLLGGITTGADLIVTVHVKPTPTHGHPQRTVDLALGTPCTISCTGRHDMNFAPRVGPVAAAMTCLVLADHALRSGLVHPVRWPEGASVLPTGGAP